MHKCVIHQIHKECHPTPTLTLSTLEQTRSSVGHIHIRNIQIAFLFSLERVALRSMLSVALWLLSTRQLFASVLWRSGCFLEQRMALLIPLEYIASSFWRIRRQILQTRQEEYFDFLSTDVKLVFWVFLCPVAVLLSFEYNWILTTVLVSGLDVT